MSEKFLYGQALQVERLTPAMVRVRVGGEDLAQFEANGTSDEWVRLAFPLAKDKPAYDLSHEDSGNWSCRPYTVRKWDSGRHEMTVDFVLHEGGVASTWAASAKVGDMIGIGRGGGKFEPAIEADWFCLLADISALPAAARILEELPAGLRVIAHLEVPHSDDRQVIRSKADLALTWHETFGQGGQATRLAEIARGVDLPAGGAGYIWIAGEASAAAGARSHFRDVTGLEKDRIRSVGYWIEGQARG